MVSFSLQGASSNLFEIQGGNVVLRRGATLDFETQRSHELTVIGTASDGDTIQQTFKIDVQNISGNVKGSSRSEACEGTDEEDRIMTGRGNDVARSGQGDDRLYGEDGHDRLYGGGGNDRVYGSRGNDRLDGGEGHDRLLGGSGHDRLEGRSGDDKLEGGSGRDRLSGGSGDDRLEGGAGNDRVTGGSGEDIFVFQKGGGRDVVTDFRHGRDEIDVSRLASRT
jgi:Ca2+-binding RTX toxin-like protein